MIDVQPEPSEEQRAAIALALARVGVRLERQVPGRTSAWVGTALREAVGAVPEPEPPYTPSPRRTRGATRA